VEKSKPPRLALGPAELDILSILNKVVCREDVLSFLLKKGSVTSKSAGEKALNSLEEKGFIHASQKEIKVTEAGKLLQRALALTGVIRLDIPEHKGGKEGEKNEK